MHKKQFYLKERAQSGHNIEKCFIFALSHTLYNAFEKLRGRTHATYSFLALKTKFAGFILSAVCSNLTLFTLLSFGVFRRCR